MINNIHCLALNYKGIGKYNEDPIYFIKSKSSLLYEGETVPYPSKVTQVWTEVELGIVIKKPARNIIESEAIEFIEGFFVAGDITCNSVHGRDHHLAFSKSREGFCPISTDIQKIDSKNIGYLKMYTYINGKCKQEGTTEDMIFNPYKTVSFISSMIPLMPGDIILTGTPTTKNGGPQYDCLVNPGDSIKHVIDGVGELNYNFSI